MPTANPDTYLRPVVEQLMRRWPDNRTVNIVCHGHSVPSGYFATPRVNTFNAYPHLLHQGLNERFPFSVTNVIVTAIGGENSESGAARFQEEVLCHRPDVLTLDYALNDRGIGLEKAREAWCRMIETALERNIKIILMTPTWDISCFNGSDEENRKDLQQHAEQVRELAARYEVGLADSYSLFEKYIKEWGDGTDLLSWFNHPNRKGHELVAAGLLRWFAIRDWEMLQFA